MEPLESKNVIFGHKNGIKLFKTQNVYLKDEVFIHISDK
jgi:hypothetical protein